MDRLKNLKLFYVSNKFSIVNPSFIENLKSGFTIHFNDLALNEDLLTKLNLSTVHLHQDRTKEEAILSFAWYLKDFSSIDYSFYFHQNWLLQINVRDSELKILLADYLNKK